MDPTHLNSLDSCIASTDIRSSPRRFPRQRCHRSPRRPDQQSLCHCSTAHSLASRTGSSRYRVVEYLHAGDGNWRCQEEREAPQQMCVYILFCVKLKSAMRLTQSNSECCGLCVVGCCCLDQDLRYLNLHATTKPPLMPSAGHIRALKVAFIACRSCIGVLPSSGNVFET